MKKLFKILVLFVFLGNSSVVFGEEQDLGQQPTNVQQPSNICADSTAALTIVKSRAPIDPSNIRSDREKREFAEEHIKVQYFDSAHKFGFFSTSGTLYYSDLNRQSRPLPHAFKWSDNRDVSPRRVLTKEFPAILIDMNLHHRGKDVETHLPVVGYSFDALLALSRIRGGVESLHSKITGIPVEAIPDEIKKVFALLKKADTSHALLDAQDVFNMCCFIHRKRGDFTASIGRKALYAISDFKRPAFYTPSDSSEAMLFIPVYARANTPAANKLAPREAARSELRTLLEGPDVVVPKPVEAQSRDFEKEMAVAETQKAVAEAAKIVIGPNWVNRQAHPVRRDRTQQMGTHTNIPDLMPSEREGKKEVPVVAASAPELVEAHPFDETSFYQSVDHVREAVSTIASVGGHNSPRVRELAGGGAGGAIAALHREILETPKSTLEDLRMMLADDQAFIGALRAAISGLKLAGLVQEQKMLEEISVQFGYGDWLGISTSEPKPEDLFSSRIVGTSSEKIAAARKNIFENLFSEESSEQLSAIAPQLVFHSEMATDLVDINPNKHGAIANKLVGLSNWVKTARDWSNLGASAITIRAVPGVVMLNPGGMRLYVHVEAKARQIQVLGATDRDDDSMEKILQGRLSEVNAALQKSGK